MLEDVRFRTISKRYVAHCKSVWIGRGGREMDLRIDIFKTTIGMEVSVNENETI